MAWRKKRTHKKKKIEVRLKEKKGYFNVVGCELEVGWLYIAISAKENNYIYIY